MNAIERQILLNQIAILEALAALSARGQGSTRELLQQRYRELVRAEILQTVANADDLDDELRHLLSILQP